MFKQSPRYNNYAFYMSRAFADIEEFSEMIDEFSNCLHDLYMNEDVLVDTLIGSGNSGALVIPHIARELDLYWAIARKGGAGSHSNVRLEGRVGKAWVFVDDLIDTGGTLRRCKKIVDSELARVGATTEFSGAILYENCPGEYLPPDVAMREH